MKIKAEITIATGQYENIKPIIDIEVPDGLTGEELYLHLYERFHNINRIKEAGDAAAKESKVLKKASKWKLLQAQKEGKDIDNSAYLGDMDRMAELTQNSQEHPNIAQQVARGDRNS